MYFSREWCHMIYAVCVIWLGWVVPALGLLEYGQPSAALWKDQLFVAVTGKTSNGFLYRGTFVLKGKEIRSPIEHVNPFFWDVQSSQAKLDIRDDRVLLLQGDGPHYIFPLQEVPLLERNAFAGRLIALRGYPDYTAFIDRFYGSFGLLLFPEHREPDVPVPKGGWPAGYCFRHDIQIAGQKSVRLFHAYKDKLFVSIEPDYVNAWYWDDEERAPKKNLPKPPERQLHTGKLPADFTEQFAAYTSDKRDYLVTPNGKVYMAVPKGKTEVEVTAVWNDPERQIVGVVQDQANGAVYGWGFVTDSAAPERFYVKMEPRPVAVGYKRTVPLWGDRSDAYLESYECARAFRKANEKK
jgi:hypothetical protein